MHVHVIATDGTIASMASDDETGAMPTLSGGNLIKPGPGRTSLRDPRWRSDIGQLRPGSIRPWNTAAARIELVLAVAADRIEERFEGFDKQSA